MSARFLRPEIVRQLAEARVRAPEVWLSDEPESVTACAELVEVIGPLSLAEIGVLLGRSRQRVGQIEEVALRRLVPRMRLAGIGGMDA